MAKQYDYLIVGAGIYGATFACMAHRQGKRCLVIDKRNHLGGNIYCENIEGINVHKYGAHIKLNTDFFDNRQHWEQIADKILYTGKLDEYFDYQYGKLEYRTVRFEEEILDTPNYQGNAVMNFTVAEVPYTRIIEHKHFEMFGDDVYKCPKTVISREYSTEWKDGMEPYYSVKRR